MPPGGATASQYSSAAQELRKCARDLRAMIPTYEGLLAGVATLNNPGTWFGQYPDQVSSQLGSWLSMLRAGKDNLLTCAASWDQLASTYEGQAKNAHSAHTAKVKAAARSR